MPSIAIDWSAVNAAAGAFRLAMPRTPVGGTLGDRLGSGAGSSLEFQDYRQYTAGDDLRHVDWQAYARSEILTVRLYREEVAPRVDLIFDNSRSMTVTEKKQKSYGELCGLLACASAATETGTRLVTNASETPQPFGRPEEIQRFLNCDATVSAFEEPHVFLRRRSIRVAVSDFLFPHDPEVLVGRLARDGATLTLIQLTLPEEAEPEPEGGQRLVDAESGTTLDLVLDGKVVKDYRERFTRLRLGLAQATRRRGAGFTHILAGTPVRDMARALVTAGVLEFA